MTIDSMLNDLIKREGGYVHLPQDKGGSTHYGITQGTLAFYRGYPVSIDDVKNLTELEAKDIYKKLYYITPHIDKLPEPLNNLIFDFAVNSGPSRAIIALQESLGVTADGVLGPITMAAALSINIHDLINRITKWRIMMFARIVKKDPTQLIFLSGWLSRALEFIA